MSLTYLDKNKNTAKILITNFEVRICWTFSSSELPLPTWVLWDFPTTFINKSCHAMFSSLNSAKNLFCWATSTKPCSASYSKAFMDKANFLHFGRTAYYLKCLVLYMLFLQKFPSSNAINDHENWVYFSLLPVLSIISNKIFNLSNNINQFYSLSC